MKDLTALTDKKLIKVYEHQCSCLFTAMRGDPYHVTAKKSQENWERLDDEITRRGLLRDRLDRGKAVTSEQPELTALYTFQVLILPSLAADGVAAHLGGDVAADGDVEVLGAAFAHGSDDLLNGKDPVGSLPAQLVGDGENFITAGHAPILPCRQVSR